MPMEGISMLYVSALKPALTQEKPCGSMGSTHGSAERAARKRRHPNHYPDQDPHCGATPGAPIILEGSTG
eukprot:scaffold292800_cov30-Tisochrysis_lutea.AAC.2